MRTGSDLLCLPPGSPERSPTIPAGMLPPQAPERLRISRGARESRDIMSMSAETGGLDENRWSPRDLTLQAVLKRFGSAVVAGESMYSSSSHESLFSC